MLWIWSLVFVEGKGVYFLAGCLLLVGVDDVFSEVCVLLESLKKKHKSLCALSGVWVGLVCNHVGRLVCIYLGVFSWGRLFVALRMVQFFFVFNVMFGWDGGYRVL